MNKIQLIRLGLFSVIIMILASSCSQSKNVASGHWIQKRKYQTGFFVASKHSNNEMVSNGEKPQKGRSQKRTSETNETIPLNESYAIPIKESVGQKILPREVPIFETVNNQLIQRVLSKELGLHKESPKDAKSSRVNVLGTIAALVLLVGFIFGFLIFTGQTAMTILLISFTISFVFALAGLMVDDPYIDGGAILSLFSLALDILNFVFLISGII